MKLGYYPGCSLHSTALEYDKSFRAVCGKLGIELKEIPQWICCGTIPAVKTSRLLSISLPLKNLSLAEQAGINEIVVPCASCFSRFKTALYEIGKNSDLMEEITGITGLPYNGGVRVIHPIEIFANIDPGIIESSVTRDLSSMKVVCYYGCVLTRPPKIMQPDNSEYPMMMDRLLEVLDISVLDWSYKTDCCGGSLAISETELVMKLFRDIMEDAIKVGADVIAVACPLCHANLDTRQNEIEDKYGIQSKIPILYFTQLMGLAFGISPKKLGLNKHLVDTEPVVSRIPA
jgi:heterodisulfide reductase subunit B